ncbi:MAG: hypothetical protein EOO90_06255 [Pedobacter sp.]|nr:MAG: hypothetical protein EOO90_06255 [Pedobacter sp.]
MAKYRNRQIVKHSVVFGQELTGSSALLSTIDKSTCVKIITRLNYLARHSNDFSVDAALNTWFGTSNEAFREEVRERIYFGYQDMKVSYQSLSIINLWSNLTLLDQILNTAHENESGIDGDEAERRFFHVYLACNEKFGDGSNEIVKDLDTYVFENKLDWWARQLMTTLIKYHDFAHVEQGKLLVSQFIKTYYCFKFLEAAGHQVLVNRFLQPYGVSSWMEYLHYILPICFGPVLGTDKSGLYYFSVPHADDRDKRLKFIQQLALGGEVTYAVRPDFLNVRSRPLYETEIDRFLITDTILAINRIHNSLFFELLAITEKNKKEHPGYSNFFSYYTTEYIEKYLAYTLLDKIYAKTSYYRMSGQQIKDVYGVQSEPDYYVRNGNKVFLYEVKGSMITGKAKQSFSYTELEAELKLKYYFNAPKDKNLGVLQLVDRIRILLSEVCPVPYDTNAKQRGLKIFPILLVSEQSLTTPGINYIFNNWFSEAIANDTELSKHRSRIHPLTVIDFDTVINYLDLFEQRPAEFEEAILRYHKYIRFKPVRAVNGEPPTRSHVESKVQKTFQSFPEYLSANYRSDAPALFMEFGGDLLKQMNGLKVVQQQEQ